MLQSIGLNEWLLVAVIVILLFGSKKLTDLFKGLGGAVKEFKKAAKESD